MTDTPDLIARLVELRERARTTARIMRDTAATNHRESPQADVITELVGCADALAARLAEVEGENATLTEDVAFWQKEYEALRARMEVDDEGLGTLFMQAEVIAGYPEDDETDGPLGRSFIKHRYVLRDMWSLNTTLASRLKEAEEALRPFASIVPSSFFTPDGTEAEDYLVVLRGHYSGPVAFTGADLARARAALHPHTARETESDR